jgi:hypothetical protein
MSEPQKPAVAGFFAPWRLKFYFPQTIDDKQTKNGYEPDLNGCPQTLISWAFPSIGSLKCRWFSKMKSIGIFVF